MRQKKLLLLLAFEIVVVYKWQWRHGVNTMPPQRSLMRGKNSAGTVTTVIQHRIGTAKASFSAPKMRFQRWVTLALSLLDIKMRNFYWGVDNSITLDIYAGHYFALPREPMSSKKKPCQMSYSDFTAEAKFILKHWIWKNKGGFRQQAVSGGIEQREENTQGRYAKKKFVLQQTQN